jgi:DMSO reductase family type II enzyme molybdopterin subunit
MRLGLTRRQFIGSGMAVAVGLGLYRLRLAPPAAEPAAAAPSTYGDWRDLYRERWRWDRVVRGTHTNANCVSSCAWNLYVRDEVVWREEQSSPYSASNQGVPDFNPRGCQKGASCSDLMVSAARIVHPLRRAGPRGSGRWRRVSWDEALDEVAGALLDTLTRRGGEGAILELGPNVDYGANTAAVLRFFRQIGVPMTDSMAQIGDLAVGGTITLGTPHTDGSSDDWFRSDYIVLWAMNPSISRIPDAHFLNEARYRGARVAAIAPDYNQSAIHADLWLSVRPGSDAALALAACHLVIEDGLVDEAYVLEQTDLPFLVRSDDQRFLREADVVAGGSEDRFAIWDEAKDALLWAPGSAGSQTRTLRLPADAKPALGARAEVRLADGRLVEVRSAFSLLRERLAAYAPEEAARITGVAPGVIRRFARDFAHAKAALILSQWGMCKNLHSDLMQRSQILLASLTGNLGRAGGGWRSGAFVALDGLGLVAIQDRLDLPRLLWTAARAWRDPDAVLHEFESMYVPSTIFHAVHGKLMEYIGNPEYGDRRQAEGVGPYLEEALAKGHFPISPPLGADPPEVIFSFAGNVLRHTRMGHRLVETLFEPAKLVVDVNFRWSETGRYADLVLPAAGWYEKVGIKYIAAFVPYVTLGDRAVAPLGEAKPEWEIFALLAERVAAEARRRGVAKTRGFRGQDCDLAGLAERFTDHGRFPAGAEEAVTEFILRVSGPSKGIALADLRREGGALRIQGLGTPGGTAGIYSDYALDEPVVPLRDFVEKKKPYPTLTGRQQFYVDHPWFLELGEELPTHKEPPQAGGAHPYTLTGGHARWSIHAMWRDQEMLLRLQRGEPVIYLNTAEAQAHGIGDHDLVRVWNDVGAFTAYAKLTGAIRPHQVHILHAWEPYQFRGGRSHQHLAPSPFKATQLVGDYGHLHWSYAHYEPNQVDRDTRVSIERAQPEPAGA